MGLVEVTDSDFEKEISEGVVLVEFWAAWCGPCNMVAPVLEEINEEMPDAVKIAKVDIDENTESPGRYGLLSVPAMILFKKGKPVERVAGFRPKKELTELIEKHM